MLTIYLGKILARSARNCRGKSLKIKRGMAQDFHFLLQNPEPQKVSELFLKASLKGSLKGFEGSLYLSQPEGPSKRIQEPFENLSRRC